jgi:hypothetical protein
MFDKHRPEEIELTAALAAFEARLRGLTPVTPRVDRDRLMFAAGAAAASRRTSPGNMAKRIGSRRWGWPAATAMMTAATLLLATMLVWQNHSPQRSGSIASLASPSAVKAHRKDVEVSADDSALPPTLMRNAVPPRTSGYLETRYIALTRGVGALSEFSTSNDGHDLPDGGPTAKPATARNLLDELLPRFTQSKQSRS